MTPLTAVFAHLPDDSAGGRPSGRVAAAKPGALETPFIITTRRPDWYADPSNRKLERWWNGRAWGPQTRGLVRAEVTTHFPPAATNTFDDGTSDARPPIWMGVGRKS